MTSQTYARLRRYRYCRRVSSTIPAVLIAAGGVGLAHAVLPDHWVPLAVIARSRRDPLPRVARLSLLVGIAHVVVSLVLGAVVVVVGLSVRSAIESRTDLIVGLVLAATGVAFLLTEATGHGHHHEPGHHDRDVHAATPRGLALLIPFGAAASPDLTILPVFLAAATLGVPAAVGSLVVFSIVTLATFVGLTTVAAASGYQVRGEWINRYANVITAVVLITIGVLVATHAI